MFQMDEKTLSDDIDKILEIISKPLTELVFERIGDINQPTEEYQKRCKYVEALIFNVLVNISSIELCKLASLYDSEKRQGYIGKSVLVISKLILEATQKRLKESEKEYEKFLEYMKTTH